MNPQRLGESTVTVPISHPGAPGKGVNAGVGWGSACQHVAMETPLIRRPHPDEAAELMAVGAMAFGWSPPADGPLSAWQHAHFEPYAWCAEVAGRPVAKTAAFAMETTVPGGGSLPTPGVTSVAVRPTHRRRGLLRALMTRQLREMVEDGVPATVLTASEGSIYGRFGFGVSTLCAHLEISRTMVGFLDSAPGRRGGLSLEPMDATTARGILPGLHEAQRAVTPGMSSRPALIWDDIATDHESGRHGRSELFHILARDDGGRAVGALGYRIESGPAGSTVPGSVVRVHHLIASEPDVAMDLWRVVLDLDLTRTVTCYRAIDEPLPWALVDPNAVSTRAVSDWTWMRILDLPAVFGARGWYADGEVVIGVVDEMFPANHGSWMLTVERGAAHLTPTDREPLVVGPISSWATLYMGTVRAGTLAAAGRLEGDPGALVTLGAMFATPTVPFNDVTF